MRHELPPSFEAVHIRELLTEGQVMSNFFSHLKMRPRFTTSAVVVIVLVHLLVLSTETRLWLGFLVEPFADMRTKALWAFGARHTPSIVDGEWWRLISCIFLHGDVMHLAFNMVALFGLGRLAEAVHGPARLAFLLLVAGVSGSLLSMFAGTSISVGASGSVFGLLGWGVVFGWRHRKDLPTPLRRFFGRGLMPWVILNLGIGLMVPNIDNLGHLGGLIGGAVLANLLGNRIIPGEEGSKMAGRVMGLVSGVAIVWTLAMMADSVYYWLNLK